jgi:CRISPR-associated protein Csm1
VHYWPARAIANCHPTIPYPQPDEPKAELECLRGQIQQKISQLQLNPDDWQNLSLLTLILEKFGSYLSFGEPDVALIDIARSTAAVAAALVDNPDLTDSTQLSLIAGDLSGIQKFIYTISSDGALKSLRARSFYLELVTEEIVQQLLAKLKLPRTNVIYAGGGNLYLLAAATDQTKEAVKQVREEFNQWFLDEFQGQIFLALDCLPFPVKHVANKELATHWSNISTKNLAGQKSRKFADPVEQLTKLLQQRDSHEPCRVCHRDDVKQLKQLNNDDPDSVNACGICRRMFRLGGQLLHVDAIVRSPQQAITTSPIRFTLRSGIIYYHLFDSVEKVPAVTDSNTLFLVNNWTVNDYRKGRNIVPLLLGNYAKESEVEPGTTIRANELASEAKGIKRVGYLRMDVDRLGQIFAKGLGENQTLPRLAALSRQMSYFFKIYLNSLAENRLDNLPKPHEKVKCLTQNTRQNLLFIYAGGDDLFISGAWNEVVEFAFDVYQCFRAYTGKNPDITLSGGISLADAKFPLYQAADESGEAEEKAKGKGRDSLGLFGEVFKWDEWLGINTKNIAILEEDTIFTIFEEEIKDYLSSEALPDLFGVFPFVEQLINQLELNSSRSFVRNLLITAQMQEQMLEKLKDKSSEEQKAVRYYLHLPKIAYTLARLPVQVRNQTSFASVRTSLKSPYNAPYFRAIATWIELLNRSQSNETTTQPIKTSP